MVLTEEKTQSQSTIKVNLGCGERRAKGWINLDFNSIYPDVIPCNLLKPLPFDDNSIDCLYTSHMLEHFPRSSGKTLIENCYQKLKPGGTIRIVVPDLENICREYLNILTMDDNKEKKEKYEWIILELLDQLVRNQKGGDMFDFLQNILNSNNQKLIDYVSSRLGYIDRSDYLDVKKSLIGKIKSINFKKLRVKIINNYIKLVTMPLSKELRSIIVSNTEVGEKHQWMYDRYSLSRALAEVGFKQISFLTAEKSNIEKFSRDYLDTNLDGSHHKKSSIYCEAIK